jgi:hypothetical protein
LANSDLNFAANSDMAMLSPIADAYAGIGDLSMGNIPKQALYSKRAGEASQFFRCRSIRD